MLTLYYSPGACSLVSHIALEEAGARYEAKLILLSKNEQLSESYLKINPRGRVPALATNNGVLTENAAILAYIAKTHPAAKLLPTDPWGESCAVSWLGFFSSSVHAAFSHFGRPQRYTTDESAFPAMKDTGRQSFFKYCKEIDDALMKNQWLLGSYSICDGYPLVFYNWGLRAELPMKDLRGMTRHYHEMMERPAVKKAVEEEGPRR
jgi:glutathione S-transferase